MHLAVLLLSLAAVGGGQNAPSKPNLPEAKAQLTAWFMTRSIPLWLDHNGSPGQWEEIGPRTLLNGWGGAENSGRMTSLAVDPHDSRVIYAGAASGGVWKTTDGAKSWKPLTDFYPSLSYGAITIDPFDSNVVYAGMGEPNNSADSFHGDGLMRSRDGGATWTLLSSNVFIGQKFSRIVCNPDRPGLIYAATSRGVLRSTDSGASWVELLKGDATDLALDPNNPDSMIAALGYPFGSPVNGLYKSDDAGQTWRKLTRDLPYRGQDLARLQFSQCANFPQVIYASMYGLRGKILGLMKTVDFGRSWIRLPNAPDYAGGTIWYYDVVAVSPANPNILFLAGPTTYRSLDGGQTWIDDTRSYGNGTVHPDHHAITFDPSDAKRLYLCTDGGIFRTDDVGEHWHSVSRGLATVQFQSVDVHPSNKNIAWGGTQDNGTNKYRGQLDWTNTFAGDGGVTRVNPKNPNVVYTEYVNLAMLKSTDGGENWTWGVTEGIDLAEGALFYAPYNLDPSNPEVLVAGTRRVYRSTDASAHWAPISPILGSRVSAITIAPNQSRVIYAGTNDARMWVTPDTGKSWFEVSRGLPQGYVGDICIEHNNSRHVYIGLTTWEFPSLWRTTDAGGAWQDISDNLPPVPVHAVALNPYKSTTVYAATEVGVFVSTTGRGNWRRLGRGLPNAPVYSLVVNQKTGYITVGTHGRGAWRIPLRAD